MTVAEDAAEILSDLDSVFGGVTGTLSQGGSSASLTSAQLFQKDRRRETGPGLDQDTCTFLALASAIGWEPHPGCVVVLAGDERWTVVSVNPASAVTGLRVLRAQRPRQRGTPTVSGGLGGGEP